MFKFTNVFIESYYLTITSVFFLKHWIVVHGSVLIKCNVNYDYVQGLYLNYDVQGLYLLAKYVQGLCINISISNKKHWIVVHDSVLES